MVYVQWRDRAGSYFVKYADEETARQDIATGPFWTRPIALFKPKAPAPVGKYEDQKPQAGDTVFPLNPLNRFTYKFEDTGKSWKDA
jgi:hypothetical protein